MPAHISGVMHASPSPVWLPYPDDVNALMPSLWSAHTTKDEAGMSIAGHRVNDLARTYSTPLFLFDVEDMRARAKHFATVSAEAFAAIGTHARGYYAGKAFLSTRVARIAAEAGLGIDTCSLGEMKIVRQAGIDPSVVGLHGNNKSTAELEYALDWGIGRIILDSLDEIDRLEHLARARGVRAHVLLRVRVGVEAHTHDFIATAHEDQKFGLSLSTGEAREAAHRVMACSHLELLGLHSHIGSQIFDRDGFAMAAKRIMHLRAEILHDAAALGEDSAGEHSSGTARVSEKRQSRESQELFLSEVDLGGGFGIRYTSQDTPRDWNELAQELASIVADECSEAGTDIPAISFEPGRAIIGPAMCTLYTVGTVKTVHTVQGERTYISVDGGMSDNIRTALYDADYSCTLASRVSAAAPQVVRVVGKHCESGDIIVRDEYLPADTRGGDLIAVPGTGAYCYPLASNYNHLPRPGILACEAGKEPSWVVEPEDYDRLFALDPGFRAEPGHKVC